jgi:hypothetical protein
MVEVPVAFDRLDRWTTHVEHGDHCAQWSVLQSKQCRSPVRCRARFPSLKNCFSWILPVNAMQQRSCQADGRVPMGPVKGYSLSRGGLAGARGRRAWEGP